ncbi:MAG: isoaspartyl peptidase/L-asparaginase, partial [Desulfurococcaceae archaeon]
MKALMLHGGAGAWKPRPGVENAIEAVKKCTKYGWRVLNDTNSSLETVVNAVKCMENSGYLN